VLRSGAAIASTGRQGKAKTILVRKRRSYATNARIQRRSSMTYTDGGLDEPYDFDDDYYDDYEEFEDDEDEPLFDEDRVL
jgi:hypothetical protein